MLRVRQGTVKFSLGRSIILISYFYNLVKVLKTFFIFDEHLFYMKPVIIVFLVILLASCSKPNNNNPTTPIGTAGKGGFATLQLTIQHHATYVYLGKVYIRYNATDKPATYDDSTNIVVQNGVPHAYFTQLQNGDYYLYGIGNDTINHYNPVFGGLPYHISTQDTNRTTLFVSEQ